MKRYYSGLLVIHPLISTSCSASANSVKNRNDHSPPLKQATHTQAAIPAENAPDKKSRPLFRILKKYRTTIIAPFALLRLWASLYIPERSLQIPRLKLGDIVLLKIINTNAFRHWKNRQSNREIIRLKV